MFSNPVFESEDLHAEIAPVKLAVSMTLDNLVEPIVQYLKTHPADRTKDESGQSKYSITTMQYIKRSLSLFDTAEIEVTYDTYRKLHQDPVANMLRRPIFSEYIRDWIKEYSVSSTAQAEIRDSLLHHYEAFGYHYFQGQSERCSLEQLREICAQDSSFTSGVFCYLYDASEPIRNLFARLSEEYRESNSNDQWITDPGHGFAGLDFSMLGSVVLSNRFRIPKERAVDFILVENDEFAFWFDMLSPLIRAPESHFDTGEDTLALLNARSNLPEVLLNDIDLGKGMHGLELVMKIRELANQRGQDVKIYCYTSAFEIHQAELERLKTANVIQGYFNKRCFDVPSFIQLALKK